MAVYGVHKRPLPPGCKRQADLDPLQTHSFKRLFFPSQAVPVLTHPVLCIFTIINRQHARRSHPPHYVAHGLHLRDAYANRIPNRKPGELLMVREVDEDAIVPAVENSKRQILERLDTII
jgi:hypothetical protein